ncbi:MAG: peptidase S1, partial [Burkholderiaceae bacterium]
MRKSALYSRSTSAQAVATTVPAAQRDAESAAPDSTSSPVSWRLRLRRISLTDPRLLWAAIGLLSLLLIATITLALRPGARALTQDDINAAVLH